MKPHVFFSERFDAGAIRTLFDRACGCENGDIRDSDRVAVKVHFGEKDNTRFVPPTAIQPVVTALKERNSDFFLTDANTLYRGMRMNATDHLKIAVEHGFGTLRTRIIIADGELGDEEEEIEIDKPIFRKVKIARQIARSDAVVAVSHFKGHILFGFGGAIKNLGMGCGSRAGKLEMHSKIKPSVGAGCLCCEQCIEICPVGAITFTGERAEINRERCIGCAKCIAVCENGAIEVPWAGATSREAQERCAEYAFGAVLGKKRICITFINNITSDCDCMHDSRIIGRDVGIVSSTDPVACDQAAYDLTVEKNGRDIFRDVTGVDGTHLMKYGERIGLGRREYTLVKI
ncbi:MAG: DUF362 domain-containing protein [Syntrophales bacterium]